MRATQRASLQRIDRELRSLEAGYANKDQLAKDLEPTEKHTGHTVDDHLRIMKTMLCGMMELHGSVFGWKNRKQWQQYYDRYNALPAE